MEVVGVMKCRQGKLPHIHGATWQAGNNILPKVFNPTIATSLDSENNSTTALSSTTGLLPSSDVLAGNGSQGGFWPGFTWPYMNLSLWGAPPLEWSVELGVCQYTHLE